MKFRVVGPQTRGPMFHIHIEGCRDIPKSGVDSWSAEAENVDALIKAECASLNSEREVEAFTAAEFKVFPCARGGLWK